MFANDLLAELLGVYRCGSKAVVYVRPGYPDWQVVADHEFTHLVLGTSTTSGLLHELIAYMGNLWDHPASKNWRELLQHAVQLATTAHEATATFMCLSRLTVACQLPELYREYEVPHAYQQYYEILDSALPSDLDVEHRQLVARSLAFCAFNDPLSAIRNSTIDEIWGRTSQKLLPRIDQRFEKLLAHAKKDLRARLVDAVRDLGHNPVDKELPVREFLRQRRKWVAMAEAQIVDFVRCNVTMDIIPYSSDEYDRIVQQTVAIVRDAVNARAPGATFEFSRIMDQSDDVDPGHYDMVVLLPPGKVSGLQRIDLAGGSPVPAADLVDVVKAAADCWLTDTLILRKGQYYTRFFRIRDSHVSYPVFYCITDGFPTPVAHCRCAVLSLGVAPLDTITAMTPEVSVSTNAIVLKWLAGMQGAEWERIKAARSEWRLAFGVWEQAPQVASCFFFHVPTNTLWVTAVLGAALEIFVEEGQRFLLPINRSDPSMKRALQCVSVLYHHVSPSEGKPVR